MIGFHSNKEGKKFIECVLDSKNAQKFKSSPFIIASKDCSTKQVSKSVPNIFKLI